MNLAMTGVDHQPLEVRLVDQALEQRFPYAVIAPATEASMGVFPVAISRRQVAPGGAGSQNPQNRIDELAIVLGDSAPLPGLTWEIGFKQRPMSI